jgi:hypothetical protein
VSGLRELATMVRSNSESKPRGETRPGDTRPEDTRSSWERPRLRRLTAKEAQHPGQPGNDGSGTGGGMAGSM